VELMPSQKAETFRPIKDAGFDPSEFGWRVEQSMTTTLGLKEPCSVIFHKTTGYYHIFRVAVGHDGYLGGTYSPGAKEIVTVGQVLAPWTIYIGRFFPEWLGYLKRELSAPTPWEDLAKRLQALPSLGSPSWGDNAQFTPTEMEYLRRELDAIRAEIQASHRFNQEQAAAIEEEFAYVKAALDRLGRFDWRKAALGAFCSLAVRVGVPVVADLIVRLAARFLGASADQLPASSDTV